MKMMKTKKILSVLLSVIMLLGIIPVGMISASAADDVLTYDISDGEVTVESCSISATGAVVIPSSYNGYPVTEVALYAFQNCSKVKSITVPDSVKKIGKKAFSGCTLLEEVSLGKGVENIGTDAFLDCDSLGEITVSSSNSVFSSDAAGVLYNKAKTELLFYPVANQTSTYTVAEKVEKIADSTFSMSMNVKKIILGDNVKEIGNNAFMGSRLLETVEIGKSVTKIGNQAFNYCEKLEAIKVSKDNSVYESDSDGILYNKGKTEIRKYPENNAKTAVDVASGIKVIRTDAFLNADNIKTISFPKSVTEIETSAFSGCVSITDVYYAGSEAEWNKIAIGSDNNAIKNAKITFAGGTLHTHTYKETATVAATCKTAGSKTLKCDCGDVKTETIPATGHTFTNNVCTGCSIQEFVLSVPGTDAKITGYNGNGGAVVINEKIQGYTVTAIADNAFEGKTAITSFKIPSTVIDIGSNAFYNTGCYNNASNWTNKVLYIDDCLIQAKADLSGECTIKDGTRLIADYAFAASKNIASINLPEETEIIGDFAFSGCNLLDSVKVNVTEEEWKASAIIGTGNENFTNATFTYLPHTHEFIVKDGAGVAATCLEAGKKVSECKCGETKEEVIPAKGHNFVDNKCTSCDERKFNITVIDDKVTVTGCNSLLEGAVTVPATIGGYKVCAIADNAFAGNEKITKLVLPASIEKIGENAFAGSKIVVEFAAANGNYIIENGVLYNKDKTELIYCPASKATKEFAIPSGVTAIAASAFKGVTAIEKLTIPVTVASIGKDAFSGCTNLKDVEYEGTRTAWRAIPVAEGNNDLLKALFVYADTSDVDEAKSLAENLVVVGGTVEVQETVIVITANEKINIVAVSRLAKDEETEVVIKTEDTLVKTDNNNNYVLTFNDWHVSGNKTETEVTVGEKTCEIKFVFPVDETGGHAYDEENPESFEATCTTFGGVKIYCTICGEFKINYDSTKPSKGHSFGQWEIEKDETCVTPGEKVRTCSVCDAKETGVVPANGRHQYVSDIKAPTCTEKGYTTYECSICNNSYTEDETAATGHDFEETITIAAKCEEKGELTKICKVCEFKVTETINALGHNYQPKVIVDPTYNEQGYTIYMCENEGCGLTHQRDFVDALSRIDYVKFENVTLYKNDTHVIVPIITGSGTPEYVAEYKGYDESIISIDSNGVITAKTRGTTAVSCTITDMNGKVHNSSFTVEVKFTVWQWIEWFFVDLIYGGLRDFFSSIFAA